MKAPAFIVLALCAAAACAPLEGDRAALVEHRAAQTFPQRIDVVRGAALESLTHMRLLVRRMDASGMQQTLVARNGESLMRVDLRELYQGGDAPQATRMEVAVLAEPDSAALGRFLEGVRGILQ